MNGHIARAKENEEVLIVLNTHLPDYSVEWPITLNFYIALHYLKAYLKYKHNIDIHSHNDIDEKINPVFNNTTQLSQDLYVAYNNIECQDRQDTIHYEIKHEKQLLNLTKRKLKKD